VREVAEGSPRLETPFLGLITSLPAFFPFSGLNSSSFELSALGLSVYLIYITAHQHGFVSSY
jgi:hypothetical protein